MNTSIGIIIPTHNRKNELIRLIDQLQQQRNLTDIIIKIILVVDGSNDGTLELLNIKHPELITIQGDGNWWFTKSVNEGLKHALYLDVTHCLILNDDVQIESNYIENLLAAIDKTGNNAIIGSISLNNKKPQRILFSGVKKIIPYSFKYLNLFDYQSVYDCNIHQGVYETELLIGRGSLIPAQILHEIGIWDERLPQYGSDEEFTLKAKKKGYKLYINLNAVLFVDVKLTSSFSSKSNPKLGNYIKGFFNKYSANYMFKNIYLFWKYSQKLYFPLFIVFLIFGLFKSYYKHKKI